MEIIYEGFLFGFFDFFMFEDFGELEFEVFFIIGVMKERYIYFLQVVFGY